MSAVIVAAARQSYIEFLRQFFDGLCLRGAELRIVCFYGVEPGRNEFLQDFPAPGAFAAFPVNGVGPDRQTAGFVNYFYRRKGRRQ
jgi:hypothetical protein